METNCLRWPRVSGDRSRGSETPSTRYFPIAIITLIRVNRAGTPGGLYDAPLSKWSDEDTTVRKWSRRHKGAFHFNPFDVGWTFARLAGVRGDLSREACRATERRVNYIFVLPILGKPDTGLLSRKSLGPQESELTARLRSREHAPLWFELKRRAVVHVPNRCQCDTATIRAP